MTLDGDGALWHRVLGGDEDAFATLFARHHARVFRHAARLLPDADADDAMAVAFFELWRARSRVRLVEDSILPWLLVTVTNVGRNSARGTRRYRAVLRRLPRDLVADPVQEAETRLQRREDRSRLARALDSLSRVDAALLALTAIDGMTSAEAAGALDLSPGAARVRIHRARLRLRALLDDDSVHLEADAEETLR